MWLLLPLLVACSGGKTYIVEGVVREVPSPTELVIDHEAIAGFMGAMEMTFPLASAEVGQGIKPGDRVVGRLVVGEEKIWLEKVRVVGHDPTVAATPSKAAPMPLRPGEALADVVVSTPEGSWNLHGQPTLLTFLYTTCPMPEVCPATTRRLQELQGRLKADNPARARLLAVTVDPQHDTPEVLAAYAVTAGADPSLWRLGRVDGPAYAELLGRASLYVEGSDKARHAVRLLVLDAGGRLIERYDDNRFPTERVLQQLQTGGPVAPAGASGTSTP